MGTHTDQVALVTGGSRGIGAAVARRLAADGFATVITYRDSAAAAAGVVEHITSTGGRALAVQADIAEADQVTRLFDAAERAFGPPRVVVNAAGIMELSPLATCSDDMVRRMLDTNLWGTINVLRQAAQRVSQGGRIIALSSSVVGLKLPGYTIYAATKAAAEVMGAILAKELRGRAVTVNAVAPGPTATDLFLDGKSDAQIEALAQANPMERLGQPEDIAGTVAFLAGPDGGWINGQCLRANGGMV